LTAKNRHNDKIKNRSGDGKEMERLAKLDDERYIMD